jgi:hypothetical protein
MENKKICKKCGGDCCKNVPGAYHPKDMLIFGKKIKKGIVNAILSGEVAIDWYDGDPRVRIRGDKLECVYYLRPRHFWADSLYDRGLAGTHCIYWESYGCQFKHDYRPRQCRELDPKTCRIAKSLGEAMVTKRTVAMWWIRYQNIIADAAIETGEPLPVFDSYSPFAKLAMELGFLR